MKPEDQNACGIDKLAKEEREALQIWIQKYTSDAKPSKIETSVSSKIQAIKEGAKFIELADGRTFALSASSRKVAVLWNVGDVIVVDQGKKKDSYTLTHSTSGKSIKAKLAPQPKSAK